MSRLSMLLVVLAAAALWVLPVVAEETAGDRNSGGELVLEVSGMSCQACARKIEAQLLKLHGVSHARVHFDEQTAYVTVDEDAVTTDEVLTAVRDLGFEANEQRADGTASGDGASKSDAPSCANSGPGESTAASPDAGEGLAADDLARVADYIAGLIIDGNGSMRLELTAESIESATGVSLPDGSDGQVKNAVLTRLREYPEIMAKISFADGASRCGEYDACSLHGDLSGATGDKLAMYAREKKEDGASFADRSLPAFKAIDLGSRAVQSGDLLGRPAVLAILAGHCTHSMDTFPILQEMHRAYEPEGLQVIGVVVNSGTAEDVAIWASEFEPEYAVWVDEDASLGDLIDSHLVPTYLFVDADGRIREKLVGYKEAGVVNDWIDRLLHPAEPIASR